MISVLPKHLWEGWEFSSGFTAMTSWRDDDTCWRQQLKLYEKWCYLRYIELQATYEALWVSFSEVVCVCKSSGMDFNIICSFFSRWWPSITYLLTYFYLLIWPSNLNNVMNSKIDQKYSKSKWNSKLSTWNSWNSEL